MTAIEKSPQDIHKSAIFNIQRLVKINPTASAIRTGKRSVIFQYSIIFFAEELIFILANRLNQIKADKIKIEPHPKYKDDR